MAVCKKAGGEMKKRVKGYITSRRKFFDAAAFNVMLEKTKGRFAWNDAIPAIMACRNMLALSANMFFLRGVHPGLIIKRELARNETAHRVEAENSGKG